MDPKALSNDDKETGWTPMAYGYLTVNDAPISTPSAKVVKLIAQPSSESLDVGVTMYGNSSDFAAVHFKLYARGIGLEDEYVGHIMIWAIDIKAPEQVVHLSLEATRVQLAIPHGTEHLLSKTTETGWKLTAKLCKLRELCQPKQEGAPIVIDLLLPEHKAGFATQLVSLLWTRAESDREHSPLSPYFEHSKDVKELAVGHLSAPGTKGFPTNACRVRILHFAARHQHLLHTVAGTYYDKHLAMVASRNLTTEKFKGAVIPMGKDKSSRRFMVILDPRGNQALLPQNGESCKISFPTAKSFLSDTQVNSTSFKFFQALLEAEPSATPTQLINTKAKDYLTRELTEAEVGQLWVRVQEWAREHRDAFRPLPKDPKDATDNQVQAQTKPWWPACRVDFASPFLDSGYQAYMVWSLVDKDAKANDDGLRPLMAVDLSSQPDPSPKERYQDYFKRTLDPKNTKEIEVQRTYSTKTLRAKVHAVNVLKHPASEPTSPPSERAIAAYNFLMRFETDTWVNLLDELPSLGNIVNNEGPAFLRNIFDAMNKPMKEAFREMKKIPAGIHFVPGVAGCGKSFMLENIDLFSQFGSCPAHASAQDAQPRNLKTLYLLDNNAGVDTVVTRMTNRHKDLGIKHPLPVLRLYAMDTEVARGVKKKQVENEEATMKSDDTEGDIADYFLAARALASIAKDIDHAHTESRKAKRQHDDVSIHSAAFGFYDEHRDEYKDLEEALNRFQAGQDLGAERTWLKTYVKVLYSDFLRQFQGTIVTTPIAASAMAFREAFRPDLVLVDEAATMHELTTLIPIAFFNPHAWILTGDVAQKPPHLTIEHDQPGQITSNPYADQLTLSTLGRAVEAGATRAYLLVNQRAFGNSADPASALFYHNSMRIARPPKDNWPAPLHAMIAYVQKDIAPKLPDNECSVVIEFAGSQTTKVGTSQVNKTHITWVLDRLSQIAKEKLTGLGKNADKPMDIMILAFYEAQAMEYERKKREMTDNGRLTKDFARLIRIKTFDDAQGDEADFVFVDYVAVSFPGFLGENFRGTLATTRTRGVAVILLNRGTFVGWENHDNTRKRANQLFRIFNYHMSRGLTHRIFACLGCQAYGHTIDVCKSEPLEPSTEGCERSSCNTDSPHTSATCPTRKCGNCSEIGHSANECSSDLICPRCHGTGHSRFACPVKNITVACARCGQTGHRAYQCKVEKKYCKRCKKNDHTTAECKVPRKITCNECGEEGHIKKECPKLPCRNCGEDGHLAKDCKQVRCRRCYEIGHESKDCRRPPPKCPICRGPHNEDHCFRGKDRAPRVKQDIAVNLNWKSTHHGLTQEQQNIANEFQKLLDVAGDRSGFKNGNTGTGDAQVETDTGGEAWNNLPPPQEW
ncbi:Nonsense-mediated mRNA decay 1 [Fusarium albosuccineum]|uniref:Nonsense-mediated mRNA decay 1 n=1 Tax=Fusarium albosuccineum TaxID=1237068 RepID=A0A8H4KZN3_9HYPO|nr:Nonsense-mediated mRNA decay 1 [Fusarium albosuccineum]